MAIEARRGCGYRKVGGIYAVGEGITVGCDRLPLATHVCPTCNQGVHASLGFTWIDFASLFGACERITEKDNFEKANKTSPP